MYCMESLLNEIIPAVKWSEAQENRLEKSQFLS